MSVQKEVATAKEKLSVVHKCGLRLEKKRKKEKAEVKNGEEKEVKKNMERDCLLLVETLWLCIVHIITQQIIAATCNDSRVTNTE